MHLIAFVEDLTRQGLAGCTIDTASIREHCSMRPGAPLTGRTGDTVRATDTEGPHVKTIYERPRLEQFTNDPRSQAAGTCATGGGCCMGSHDSSQCNPGNSASSSALVTICQGGTSATDTETGWTGSEIACNTGTGAVATGAFLGCAYACLYGSSPGTCKYGNYAIASCNCGNNG